MDSVRIAFLIVTLNGLDISACDIGNAYLNTECQEKIWTRVDPEFGSDTGLVLLIEKHDEICLQKLYMIWNICPLRYTQTYGLIRKTN